MRYNKEKGKAGGKKLVIGIIGAGASGMAAALAASEQKKNTVILMERQNRVGKKLLATGNGRCNLTNLHADSRGYHGMEPQFVRCALSKYNVSDTLQWFEELGLITVCEDSGRVYPYSDQANSVVDVLRFALNRENIILKLGFEVCKIKKLDSGFVVESKEDTVFCDRLIVACGGLAGTQLGGSMSGYQLLHSMGHRVTKLRPALVQLKCADSVAALKGVRANCMAQIYKDGTLFSESTGEIQFTDYGISGPVIFEISRDVCREKGEWLCKLDFLPHVEQVQLERLICRDGEEMLTGIVHNRLGKMLAKAGDYDRKQVSKIAKEYVLRLQEPLGMDKAQVTAGGIVTADFDAQTMQSKLVPGLYACGEVLDIDGDCGGYNLQWAWSSGRSAGYHAGRMEE